MSLVGTPVIFDDPLATGSLGVPLEIMQQGGGTDVFENAETNTILSTNDLVPTFNIGGTQVSATQLGVVEIADTGAGGATLYDTVGNVIGQLGGETVGGTETTAAFLTAVEAAYQSDGGGSSAFQTAYAADIATAEGSTPTQTSAVNGSSGILDYVTDTGGTGTVTQTGGATTLSQLTDVTLTAPTNGQVLEFNGTQWINETLPASGPSIQMIEQVIAQDLTHAFGSMQVYGSQTPEVIAALGHYL